MFIQSLAENPFFYFSTVLIVIVSIVLHELAHGLAAIWQGDDTPRQSGHLTLNPLVHMGGMALVALFIVGMTWGAMPVDRSRFRSRYGDALVSLAGPACNFLLAALTLTGGALWMRFGDPADTPMLENGQWMLFHAGLINILLGLFNLIPVPPLDGAAILADVHRPYRAWLDQNAHLHIQMLVGLFVVLGILNRTDYGLMDLSLKLTQWYTRLLLA